MSVFVSAYSKKIRLSGSKAQRPSVTMPWIGTRVISFRDLFQESNSTLHTIAILELFQEVAGSHITLSMDPALS